MERADILDLKSSARMGVQGQSLSPLPRDSVLSHFVTTLQTVSKVWVVSPKKIKFM